MKMVTLLYIPIIMTTLSSYAMERNNTTRPFISTYLPVDSVLRKTSEQNPGSLLSYIPFLKSSVEQGCDEVEEILARQKSPHEKNNSAALRRAVLKALQDETVEVQCTEHRKIVAAASTIAEEKSNFEELKQELKKQQEKNRH